MKESMDTCPCGSGKAFSECCEPFIRRTSKPHTAEQLMRSRFSAYTLNEVDYLWETHHPNYRAGLTKEAISHSAKNTDWTRLDVLDHQWTENSTTAIVEFKAFFNENGKEQNLHERSNFVKEGDQWLYTDGDFNPQRASNKTIGRNDPCPCGSGKKYKKCCGR
ncbi:YchJ family protein [Sediminitomix flava]|uniref:SEC-C motif-containing protein n=1 Tax=Sediminitomix flava TaxID=379075 RepID=A0A315ZB95_SEDFL|nr:YchJ family protein [Sediminitomix flava]PWJ42630.1 SEC-C motif-containing protein [Sediminitomix flava]